MICACPTERGTARGGTRAHKESTMNRKQRRKAKASARKPLARFGEVMHTGSLWVWLDPDRLKKAFYWFVIENPDENLTVDEIMNTKELHGPFDTQAEADADAKIAIVGEDCVVKQGGTWDPAWNKPQ
jgi:hypothetical protein